MSEDSLAVHPPLISPRLSLELEKHLGRWVAIHEDRLVAAGPSLGAVLKRARKAGVDDPLTMRLPKHPELLAFYTSRWPSADRPRTGSSHGLAPQLV